MDSDTGTRAKGARLSEKAPRNRRGRVMLRENCRNEQARIGRDETVNTHTNAAVRRSARRSWLD